jgi:hypothetical protein
MKNKKRDDLIFQDLSGKKLSKNEVRESRDFIAKIESSAAKTRAEFDNLVNWLRFPGRKNPTKEPFQNSVINRMVNDFWQLVGQRKVGLLFIPEIRGQHLCEAVKRSEEDKKEPVLVDDKVLKEELLIDTNQYLLNLLRQLNVISMETQLVQALSIAYLYTRELRFITSPHLISGTQWSMIITVPENFGTMVEKNRYYHAGAIVFAASQCNSFFAYGVDNLNMNSDKDRFRWETYRAFSTLKGDFDEGLFFEELLKIKPELELGVNETACLNVYRKYLPKPPVWSIFYEEAKMALGKDVATKLLVNSRRATTQFELECVRLYTQSKNR